MSKPKLWITVAAIAAVVATSPAFADTVIITHDKPAEKRSTATATAGMRHTAGATLPAYTAAAAAEELTEGDRR